MVDVVATVFLFVVFVAVLSWAIISLLRTAPGRTPRKIHTVLSRPEAKDGLPSPPVGYKWVIHNKGDGSGILFLLPIEWGDKKLPSVLDWRHWTSITFQTDADEMNKDLKFSGNRVLGKFGSEDMGNAVSGEHFTSYRVEK